MIKIKVIQMFDHREFVTEREEARRVSFFRAHGEKWIRLRDGTELNPQGIMYIADPQRIMTWNGHALSKDGQSYQEGGERFYLTPPQKKEVVFRLPLKYKLQYYKISKRVKRDADKTSKQTAENAPAVSFPVLPTQQIQKSINPQKKE